MLKVAPPLLADDPQWLIALHFRNYKCAVVLGGTVEIHPARWLTTFTAVMADRGQPEALWGHYLLRCLPEENDLGHAPLPPGAPVVPRGARRVPPPGRPPLG